jgi:outer membrane protein assembly factor BamB
MKRLTPALSGAILALALMVWAADLRKPAAEEAGSASPPAGACPNAAAAFTDPLSAPHWNGWGVDPAQSRFQPAEMAQLAAADVPRLKLKWAFGFPGATFAFAQPTVIGGRVFIGSQAGKAIRSMRAPAARTGSSTPAPWCARPLRLDRLRRDGRRMSATDAAIFMPWMQ